jgi:tRNA A37 threonylcarbamoyladenosine dehydratase
MSQQLISHSPDLKRLRDEGYEVEIKGGYLLVHHIPYLNNLKVIKYGTLVSELTLQSNILTSKPNTHVIYFNGEYPCNKDGSIISQIQHASPNQILYEGVTVNYSFSNKPPNGYANYYEKISTYTEIISAPAKSLDNTVTEKTFKVIPDTDSQSVFNYLDTNSSRANINLINLKFKEQKIAIVGLGGTGAYILDLIAKTPVNQIHLFDGDDFLQHNAFRSPGAPSSETLNSKMKKVNYFVDIYSKMRKGIVAHDYYLNDSNVQELTQMNYVFICVDRGSTRKCIIDYLVVRGISFLDVGLGVNVVDDCLIGILRLTIGTALKNDHLFKRISTVDEQVENAYSTNIQIADLNALNAALAVIKWKKMSGFYQDLEMEHNSTYSLNVAQLINEDIAA